MERDEAETILLEDTARDGAGGDDGWTSDSLDRENRLKPSFVRRVRDSLENGDGAEVYALVEPLHPADIADLFEMVDADERQALIVAISDLMSGDVVAELNDHVRELLIETMSPGTVADLAGQLETDDAVALIEDLDADDQQAVLAGLDPEDRAAIESALAYPEESAGRLMQRDLVAVPEHMTVGGLIDYLRENGDLTTEFWEVFIVDPLHRPVGSCHSTCAKSPFPCTSEPWAYSPSDPPTSTTPALSTS